MLSNALAAPPLPGGEGWGEGERSPLYFLIHNQRARSGVQRRQPVVELGQWFEEKIEHLAHGKVRVEHLVDGHTGADPFRLGAVFVVEQGDERARLLDG